MKEEFKICLWQNFGASIEMLRNSISHCPKTMWETDKKFFYLSFHTLIFLDYYLSAPVSEFSPILSYFLANPNDLPTEAIDDVVPERHFEQREMMDYLSKIKEKCRGRILNSTDESFLDRWIKDSELDLHLGCSPTVAHYSVLEILFYNLRHLQHHVGQLNLLLRLKTNQAPDWVSLADQD